MKNFNILGAGLGGLTSSITLAKNGYKVTVFEKKDKIGGNFKKTVHSVKNYSNWFKTDLINYLKNKIGLRLVKCYHPIKVFRKFAPSGIDYAETLNNNEPILYNFLRGIDSDSLESELYLQAKNLGVNFEFNSNQNPENCQIIATGSKYLDFKGFGYHYKNSSTSLDEVKVFFNNDFAPKGYAYIVPFRDGSTTVAIFTVAKFSSNPMTYYFKKFFEYLKKFEIFFEHPISVESGIGSYNLYTSFIKNNKLYIGNAAGLMTADYGFALLNAINSGYFAAQSTINNEDYNLKIKTKSKVRNFISSSRGIYNLLNLIFARILMFTKIRKYPL